MCILPACKIAILTQLLLIKRFSLLPENPFMIFHMKETYSISSSQAGAQLGNFERGGARRRYICNKKDEIMHDLSPTVKCVAPLSIDMSFTKV